MSGFFVSKIILYGEKLMEFYTNDLHLRVVNEDDIKQVAEMWEWYNSPISKEEAKDAIKWMQENHYKNKHGHIHHLCLAISIKDTSKIIGWCGLDGQCTPGQVVLFYSVETSYQGRGYATQAASGIIKYAFENLGVNRIDAGCDKNNIASVRVLEKIGMQRIKNDENGDPLFYITDRIFSNKVKQKLIIIAGTPCVGKTTVAEILFEEYENCAHFDGDWAWRVNPFSLEDPRLRNGDKTMSFALSTYLNSNFDYVIFSSVVASFEDTRNNIVNDITADDYEIIGFMLTCSEETLTQRHKNRGDENTCDFQWLYLDPCPGDYVINTDNKSVEEIVSEMKLIIDK